MTAKLRADSSSTGRWSPAEYYRVPEVRRAVRAYCGFEDDRADTGAVFLAGLGDSAEAIAGWGAAPRVAPAALGDLCDAGCDISRSLWDHRQLVFLFELDYQNVDLPAEPFLRPVETLFKLEPAYEATRRVFGRLQLDAQPIITGRGHHFAGTVRLDDPLVARLARLSPSVPRWHAGVNARRPPGVSANMSAAHARAADGLGRLLEYAGHLVMAEAAASPIPVVFNGTVVGSGRVGRESVSIDISHAGDPLDVRHFRAAFSAYQWHRFRPDVFGSLAASLPPLAAVPRGTRSFVEVLGDQRDLESAVAAASSGAISLPNVASGLERLCDVYEQSVLCHVHRTFDRDLAEPGAQPRALDADLPACVARPLCEPNDYLLKPEHLQHVVRVLLARGWRAADIARLVQACYEEDHRWGTRWTRMDAETRARFDVRVFAGLVATGLDTLIDLNCVSAQEKDLCPGVACRLDLRLERDRLEARLP